MFLPNWFKIWRIEYLGRWRWDGFFHFSAVICDSYQRRQVYHETKLLEKKPHDWYDGCMRPTLHALVLLTAVAVAYLWLRTPYLVPFTIQAVATSTLLYFILKKTKPWHLLPGQTSFELAFVTFSLLLIIGKTGNLTSPLYPLTYIHLFFLVMSTRPSVATAVMAGATLFHLSLSPVLDLSVFIHLATLPIVMIFFLFAKLQHEEVVIKKHKLEIDTQTMSNQKNQLDSLHTELESCKSQLQIATNQLAEWQTFQSKLKQKLQSWQTTYFRCEPQIQAELEQLNQQVEKDTQR